MKKEELQNMAVPLSDADYRRLKKAIIHEEIERKDIPHDALMDMDEKTMLETRIIRNKMIADGTMGEYD